jgi:hypothetical protein
MSKLLKNLLDGMRQVFVIWPENDYVRPAHGDFRKDNDNLKADAARIFSGLRSNVKKQSHGKTYNRKCA